MKQIKKYILDSKILAPIAITIRNFPREVVLRKDTKSKIKNFKNIKTPKIFYLGIPAHNNLGDLAQGVCIRKWLKNNFPDREVLEIETNALVNTHFPLLKELKDLYNQDDLIVFQSGYTTTDLGGFADEMHRAVMEVLPNAKMLMLPQTIFFRNEENKKRTARIYNSMGKKMLYLARDEISYKMAKEMFPDVKIDIFPDIVTTLIGKKHYSYERSGIMMCCRDDGEKFYSDDELSILAEKCKILGKVDRTDTTKSKNKKRVISEAEKYIEKEIEKYAKYKLLITDRYHGTILSLVAGTPVIIIKTTDHKVTTGALWFKGIYDEYVYLADNLEEAYEIAKKIYNKNFNYKLESYFEEKYYNQLLNLVKKIGEED